LKQTLYDHHVQILALAGDYYLLLQQNSHEHCLYYLRRQRNIEEVAELEEGGAIEFVQVQNGPVATLFEENHLPELMFVELA
jgi:hypothetical protein